MIEEAWFVENCRGLTKVPSSCRRIYFGEEFCEKKVNSHSLSRLLSSMNGSDLSFTYVTPFVTQKHFDRIFDSVIKVIDADLPGLEVVFNSWGLFFRAQRRNLPCTFSLGRLLNKQKRGPEIMRKEVSINEKTIDHFSRSNTDSEYFQSFLSANGISRIEMDNLLCGNKRDNKLPGSIYFPYAYVSVTRGCKLAGCEENDYKKRSVVQTCGKECEKYIIELNHRRMPSKLFLKGNVHLVRSDVLPDDLDAINVDRVVHMAEF